MSGRNYVHWTNSVSRNGYYVFEGMLLRRFTWKNIESLLQMGRVKRICVLSIPPWQILTAHAQPSRGVRDLGFCLKVPLDSLLVWASSGGSGETARMRRLAWTFTARIGDKYQIRLARPKCTGAFLSPKHSGTLRFVLHSRNCSGVASSHIFLHV